MDMDHRLAPGPWASRWRKANYYRTAQYVKVTTWERMSACKETWMFTGDVPYAVWCHGNLGEMEIGDMVRLWGWEAA
jgi:hypothetical protein